MANEQAFSSDLQAERPSWLPKLVREEHVELFEQVRTGARLDADFLVMMALKEEVARVVGDSTPVRVIPVRSAREGLPKPDR